MNTFTKIQRMSLGWLAAAVFGATLVSGCGGGGGSAGTPPPPAQHNVASVTVDGDFQTLNSLFITVQICQHGSSTNCVTVDHVSIDTGSIGLRVLANSLNTLNASFLSNLPTVTATASTANVTGPLAECEQFGGGYTWGSVRNVDITITGTNETASNVPMQVIGDLGVSQPTCASESVTGYQLTGEDYTNSTANPLTNTYLGSNGLIGVSLFQWDCLACATTAEPQEGSPPSANLAYAVCPDMTGSGCQPTTATLAQQVANPIPSFATDNNGFIIDMNAAAAVAGSSSAVTGTMTFGIGTQTNNAIGSATKFNADPNSEPGVVQTTWNNVAYTSVFDTGSSAYYFDNTSNPTLALCGTTAPLNELYCPGGANATANSSGTTVNFSATLQDYVPDASPSQSVAFSITNPLANYLNTTIASDNIGGTVVFDYFIWGMPYFFGHKTYFGIANITAGNPPTLVSGPYYAL